MVSDNRFDANVTADYFVSVTRHSGTEAQVCLKTCTFTYIHCGTGCSDHVSSQYNAERLMLFILDGVVEGMYVWGWLIAVYL